MVNIWGEDLEQSEAECSRRKDFLELDQEGPVSCK